MKLLVAVLVLLSSAGAQAPAPLSPEEEERILKEAVSQVGNSPVDFIRAVERHLRKYPQSPRKKDLEHAVFTAAVDAKDQTRVISYGEKVLEQGDDLVALDRVARALLNSDDAGSARRSVQYSERLEKAARAAPKEDAAKEDKDRTVARALALQARAWGNQGDLEKAIALARKSYATCPTGEAAREAGRWEVRLGRVADAIEHYADAFSITDPAVTDENRKHHRTLLGELYRKLHGSEVGLGDLILRAYDRTSKAVEARETQRKAANPNAGLQDAFEFRLSGLRGDSIRLADFRGRVIILDFWATWCAPCRFTHPLFEQLKTRYEHNPGVVFVSINTDHDRSLVRPFVEELKWSDQVYFEDGLAQFYRVTSIPTTIIFNKRGELSARLPGFVPTAFVELLTEKIEEALRE